MILNITFLLNLLQLKLFTLNNSETDKISLKYINFAKFRVFEATNHIKRNLNKLFYNLSFSLNTHVYKLLLTLSFTHTHTYI